MGSYKITPTTAAVLESVRYDLFGEKPDFSGETDWAAVYDEMVAQGIRGFGEKTLAYVREKGIFPRDEGNRFLAETWQKKIRRQREIAENVLEKQDRFVKLLQKRGEKFVILKGAAAAALYEDHTCRRAGDVDVLVLPERFGAIHGLLLENGFECVEEGDRRHNEYMLDGVEFEVHRVFQYEDLPRARGKEIDRRFFENMEEPVMLTVGGRTFPTLSPENTGICLLSHFAHHLIAEGIGIRQYLDWVMYAERYLTDAYWEEQFGQSAAELGLDTLAKVMTGTAVRYFGLPGEHRHWCSGVPEKISANLLGFMIEKGNYGVKDPDTLHFFGLMKEVRSPKGFFATLQYRGEITWKTLEKHPSLRPFAWAYQLVEAGGKALRMKDPLGKFIRARSQKKMFTELVRACGLTPVTRG